MKILRNIAIAFFLFYTALVSAQELTTQFDNQFYVYQEKDKTYTVKNGKNKVKFKDLKYANNAGRGLQILTKTNEMKFLDNDKNLSFIVKPILKEELYCGTVKNFATKIIEVEDQYHVVRYNYGFSDYIDKNIEEQQLISKVQKKDITNICFANGEKEIQYDENFYYPETVIVSYGSNEMALLTENDQLDTYEAIDYSNVWRIKVKRANKWGYFGITECLFDQLDAFNYNLAFFIQNNEKGYLDYEGNLYHDKK